MALQMNFNYKGLEVPNGYLEIFAFEGTKTSLSFGLGYHAEKGSEQLFSESYVLDSFQLDSPNPVEQSYQYLKTLDKFSDAIDV